MDCDDLAGTRHRRTPGIGSYATAVARRGVALASAAALAAVVPEALHGAEDVHAGIGSTATLVVVLAVQVVAIAAALTGRRCVIRALLVISVAWIIGAMLDHSRVFIDPAGFRDGWASAMPLFALIALNAAAAIFAAAPAMPARWEERKTSACDAWSAVELDRAVVLDVRTARERASGVIPGVVATAWRHPVAPEDGRDVLVVCSHGARALLAVRTLQAQGVGARSVGGGMKAYRRALEGSE